MWLHRTFRGKPLSVDEMTPNELGLYVRLLELAGGSGLLAEQPSSPAPLDPVAFRAACYSTLRRELTSEEQQHAHEGHLGLVLEDLAERLEVAAGLAAADLIHDPALFLRRAQRERGESLSELSVRAGLDYSHLTKILRSQAGVSVDKLQTAAKSLGYAFEFLRRGAPLATAVGSCREIAARNFGLRLLALVAMLDGLNALPDPHVALECRARGLDDAAASDAIRAAKGIVQLAGFTTASPLHSVHVFEDQAPALAWVFMGIEFNWFQTRGLFVRVVRSEGATDASETLPVPAIEDDARRPSASQLYTDLVYQPLLRPIPPDADGGAAHLDYSSKVIRRAASRLLDCPPLAAMARDVVFRWHRALGWQEPDFDAIGRAFNEPMQLAYCPPVPPVRRPERKGSTTWQEKPRSGRLFDESARRPEKVVNLRKVS